MASCVFKKLLGWLVGVYRCFHTNHGGIVPLKTAEIVVPILSLRWDPVQASVILKLKPVKQWLCAYVCYAPRRCCRFWFSVVALAYKVGTTVILPWIPVVFTTQHVLHNHTGPPNSTQTNTSVSMLVIKHSWTAHLSNRAPDTQNQLVGVKVSRGTPTPNTNHPYIFITVHCVKSYICPNFHFFVILLK